MSNYRCPRHDLVLRFVLKGGAGWCSDCKAYVQAAGVPMPALDPHIQAKREAAQQPKSAKAGRAKTAKKRRKSRKTIRFKTQRKDINEKPD